MVQIDWTIQALDDLEKLFKFISEDSPQYAHLFVDRIFLAVERLGKFPTSGRKFRK
jgi:plasmid stabilization system protein ParE